MKTLNQVPPTKGNPLSKINISEIFDIETMIAGVLASLLAVILTLLVKFILFWIIQRFDKDRLFGDWNISFINSNNGKAEFRSEKIKIKHGFYHRIVMRTNNAQSETSKYSGKVWREKSFVVFFTKAKGDDECILKRFHLPPKGADKTFIGLSSAQDYDGKASVHTCILSKETLDETNFLKLIKGNIVLDATNYTMRLNK